MEYVFWISLALMAYSYIGFPALLSVWAIGKKQNEELYHLDDTDLPTVAVIVAAYNEALVMEEKLRSLVETSYPLEKIVICIGSDASTDKTNEIVANYAARYPQVQLKVFAGRTGKAGIVNDLALQAKAEILVLTDANVIFVPETLYELVKHYRNPSIVQVGGNILNMEYKKEGISFQEKSYLERENTIKYQEGLVWGSMIGAFGGCYSIRKDYFSNIPPTFLMEDFYISMKALERGGKAINELNALCYEDVSNQPKEEFRRKVRISAGNFQNLSVFWPLLFRFNGLALCFWSHKVIRWLGPFLLLFALLSTAVLALKNGIYGFLFISQLLLVATPLIDALLKGLQIHWKLLRFASHFYSMNLALLFGFIRYVKGVKASVWTPTIRNQ